MDEPVEFSPDPGFVSFIASFATADDAIAHYWDEDELVPYTEYDRERDRVAYLRLWYARHLAPPV